MERDPADAVALNDARLRMQLALSDALDADITRILSAPSPTPFDPGVEQAGVRALRISMIVLLGMRKTTDAATRLKALFDAAPNMTESLSTMRALAGIPGPTSKAAIEQFHTKWKSNPLVIDKWFGAQAATSDIDAVRALIQHPDFDFSNPNRVRAVAGVLAVQNLAVFHAPDGSGHDLLADIILDVDKRNPAVAARLLTSYEQWRRLEPKAQATAKAALGRLKEADLSKNSADILARALG